MQFRAVRLISFALLPLLVVLSGCGGAKIGPAPGPASFTTSSLSSGLVGEAYTGMINVTGGTPPYFMAVTVGSLPLGMTLYANGAISGTPTTAGTSTFTVQVSDSSSPQFTASQQFSITIAGPLSITTTMLPNATVGTAYSQTIAASGGITPYTFSLSAGTLPAGLTLSSAGVISGTPTAVGNPGFTVTVTDSTSPTPQTASAMLTLSAVNPPLTITTTALPNATDGTAYSATITATGGAAPYSFSVTSGTLPIGLSLSNVGVLSGAPSVYGTFNFTVTATDSSSPVQSAPVALTLQINPPALVFTGAALTGAILGNPYSATLQASGGVSPYSYAVTGGSLPAGLSLSSGGVLSGTPTALGNFTFAVTATDSASPTSQTVSASFTLAVTIAPLTVTSSAMPAAGLDANYTAQIQVTGGVSPYNFTVTGGSLPAGITLSNSGVLSGMATQLGANSFTVQVTDSGSPTNTTSATLSLQVVNALVQVNTGTVLATVQPEAYGVHTSVYDGKLDDTTNLPGLLQTGGISTLRYPGGIYADVYHWAQYSITPFDASTSPACGDIPNGYMAGTTNFGDFVNILQATGTQAIITVNYGTSVADSTASKTAGSYGLDDCSQPNTFGQPEEAAAWVAYANGDPSNTQAIGVDDAGFDWQTVGFWAGLRAATPLSTDDGYNFLRIGQAAPVGIKYWELGNEIFYNGYTAGETSETDIHAPYVYPTGYSGAYNSRTGEAALSPTAYGTNAIAYIQAMRAVDPTIKIGLVLSSPGVDPIPSTWNPSAIQAVCAGASFDFGIFHFYPGTYLGSTPSQLFTLPQEDMPTLVTTATSQVQQYCSNASGVQYFVTETNDNSGLSSGTPTQVLGLFAAHEYLTSFESGIANVDWLELHSSYLSSSEAPQPAYYGIELAHLMAAPGDSMVQSTSTSSGIVVHAAQKANGQTAVFLLNTNASTSATVQVSVAGSAIAGTATEYSYGTATTQTGAALAGSSIQVTGPSLMVTVPPYTAFGLTLP
jgi:hypothetical protein